jgi:hypothetical protein
VAIDIVKEGAGGICIVASRQKILMKKGYSSSQHDMLIKVNLYISKLYQLRIVLAIFPRLLVNNGK